MLDDPFFLSTLKLKKKNESELKEEEKTLYVKGNPIIREKNYE